MNDFSETDFIPVFRLAGKALNLGLVVCLFVFFAKMYTVSNI